jgi:hypothetical protein
MDSNKRVGAPSLIDPSTNLRAGDGSIVPVVGRRRPSIAGGQLSRAVRERACRRHCTGGSGAAVSRRQDACEHAGEDGRGPTRPAPGDRNGIRAHCARLHGHRIRGVSPWIRRPQSMSTCRARWRSCRVVGFTAPASRQIFRTCSSRLVARVCYSSALARGTRDRSISSIVRRLVSGAMPARLGQASPIVGPAGQAGMDDALHHRPLPGEGDDKVLHSVFD